MLEPEGPGGTAARAKLVSLRELPDIVEKAITAAGTRLGQDALPAGPIIKRWEIVGRIAPDLAAGQRFAAEVTKSLGRKVKAEPAVLQIGKHIIAGFIEPPNIPLERRF
jgi:hypothetical protein